MVNRKDENKMKDVIILGIESSCDETSISIVKNGYIEILVEEVTPSDEVEVILSVCTFLANKEKKEELIDVISKFQISNENKRLFNEVLKDEMFLNKVPKKYREPLMEITALYRG